MPREDDNVRVTNCVGHPCPRVCPCCGRREIPSAYPHPYAYPWPTWPPNPYAPAYPWGHTVITYNTTGGSTWQQ